MKMPALDRLGKPGVAAIGLLLFCLSFYAGNIAPARTELATLQSEKARLAAAARPAARGSEPAATASRPLPPFTTATDVLKELGALADRHGLTIDRATYVVSDKDGQRRLEINLPLKAGYLALREYLRDLLALPSAPSLDELNLQRQQAGEPLIEANVRISYYFAPS